MDLLELRESVLDEILNIACVIETHIKPYPKPVKAYLLVKYSEGLPPELWLKIKFKPKSDSHRLFISAARDRLIGLGVGFDSGGDSDGIYWELDWSFRLIDKAEKGELRECCSVVDSAVAELAAG